MELNESFTKLMTDAPPGYRPADFALDLRAAGDLYSTGEVNTLLDGKVNQADYDTTILAMNAAINLKANIASPVFTGTPAAPTPSTLNNSTALATTAYVVARIANDYTAADVLAKIKTVDGISSGLDSEFLGGVAYSDYAKLASPAFSGNPTVPNQSAGDISSRIANTQHVTDKVNLAFATNYTPADILAKLKTVDGAGSGLDTDLFQGMLPSDFVQPDDLTAYAPLNSPGLTGTPTAPTATPGTNTTQLATTAFVAASFAPLASPALTGTPTAPTPSSGDNSTRIATTANTEAKITALKGAANTWSANQTFSNGINFGSAVAASATDLSRHIALYGSNYGLSVTSGSQLNYVSGAHHVFYTSAGTELARISNAGALTLGTPLALDQGGTGATTAAGARTALGLAAIATSGSASDLTTGTLPNARLSGAYSGITTLDTTGRLTVTQAGEALRISGPNAADDPYMTFYAGGVRTAYIQHTDGTADGNGFRLYNDVTDDYLYLSNVNSTSALKFYDSSVATHNTVLTTGNYDALGVTPEARTITAGNGLTGGGDLSANRTLTLGTPSSITNSTTNSVTSTSHTHALGFTAAEVYTGTTRDETNLPIGHLVWGTADSNPDRNQNVSVRLHSATYAYLCGGSSGTALSGTWRNRGSTGSDRMLAQRVA